MTPRLRGLRRGDTRMTARPRAGAVTSGGTSSGDFDLVREWANRNLRELLRTYAPDAAAKLRGNRCPCPMHGGDGLNLSLFKNSRGPGELWTCHSGCGTSGGGVELVQRLTGRDALEVLRELAPRAGVSLEVGRVSPGGRRRPPAPIQTPRRPEPPAAPDAQVAALLAELRADGMVPASPAVVHTSLSHHLTLGDRGAAYLAGRGLDPDAARAYGFRSLETAAAWAALRAFLADSYLPVEQTVAGVAAIPLTGRAVLVLPYRTADGTGWDGFRLRSLEGKEYRSLKDFTLPMPFNAPALTSADEVHLVEGEMNAYTLHTYGLAALGLDGAKKWRPEWTAALRPVARLVAWYDDDPAGNEGWQKLTETLAAGIGRQWTRDRVRRVRIPKRDGCKDANDLHQRGELAPHLERAEWRMT